MRSTLRRYREGMSTAPNDVVIVGGGHNALVAAAYLARAGRTVTVLERLDHFGGAAVSERPWAGVDARLSRYSYLVSLLPAAIVDDLDLRLDLRRRRYSSYTPDPADPTRGILVDNGDATATTASFLRTTGDPREAERFAAFYDRLLPMASAPVPDGHGAAAARLRGAGSSSATMRCGMPSSRSRWATCCAAASRATSPAASR